MSETVVPFSEKLERATLGSVLVDPARLDEVAAAVSPENFYLPQHRAIFKAMLSLSAERVSPDPVLVRQKLEGSEPEVSALFLSGLIDSLPNPENARDYANGVRALADVRCLDAAMESARLQISRGATDPLAIAESVESVILSVIESSRAVNGFDGFQNQPAYCDIVEQEIDEIAAGKEPGVQCGIASVDAAVSFRPGDSHVICGETSNGKTAVALWLGRSMAEQGHHVAFASLEMPAVQIIMRLASSVSGLPFRAVERSGRTPEDFRRVVDATEHLRKLHFSVLDGAAVSISRLERALRIHLRKEKVDVLFVDYLQLLDGGGGNREQEVSKISRGLKGIARVYKIPVIACAQLRRSQFQQDGKDNRPSLARLRDSGQIEQDASVVLGAYWPHRYDESEPWSRFELMVLKERNAALTNMEFSADWTCGRFSETDPRLSTRDHSTSRDIPL